MLTGARGIHHTSVRARSITVDLVESHHNLTARSYLRKSGAVELHDHSGSGLNVVSSSTKGFSTCSCGIALEAGGVLLERLATCAVTGSAWVNCQLSVMCLV